MSNSVIIKLNRIWLYLITGILFIDNNIYKRPISHSPLPATQKPEINSI